MGLFDFQIPLFWLAWADKLVDKFWGIWSIFGQTVSTHFGTHTVSPLSMFSIIKPNKKLSIYVHIQKKIFEFGPQGIRDFAFVCPQSMSRIINHYNDSFLAQKSYFLGPITKEIL